MKLLRDLTALPQQLRHGAVAIGNFDGVHRGHARIIERLIANARRVGGAALVFTFDPHPVRLLRPDEAPPPLTWTDRKMELMVELGVDAMIAYPTDEALLQRTPEQFFQQIVVERLSAKALVEGPNFYFGRDRAGNIEVLKRLADKAGIDLEVVDPIKIGEDYVSSSRIRRLIAEGRVKEAGQLLTQPYRIRGMVTHGVGRGAKLGFPTANLEAIDTLLPADGVYAGRGYAQDSKNGPATWPAAINIGANPTFAELAHKVEVHLVGCDEPLYHQPLEVDFLARLRDIQPFADVDALRAQLGRDVAEARRIAAGA